MGARRFGVIITTIMLTVSSVLGLVIVGLIVYAVWRAFAGLFGLSKAPRKFCPACGYLGETPMQTRGHFAIEVVLWLAFLVPGLIYSIWRLSTRRMVCPQCGAHVLIPPDSPVAKAALAKLHDHT